MSTLPENEFDLDKLFLPAWAQEPSAAKYAKYEGEPEDRFGGRRDRRGPRPLRREGAPEGRRESEGRGPRPGGRRPEGGRGRPGQGARFGQGRRHESAERREPPPPLPQVNAALIPEEKGVELLARQIKMTGRAYPLFDIAQLILQKPERHAFAFSVKKGADGKTLQLLYVCALDDSLWLSEDDAVAHVLRKHFGTFYQTERTPTDPPKGKYTFVAQCGMSGAILGPPNHHDYQNQLRKLHSERFSRMPFEVYKSRVKIVRDEEVVKKWVDDQSWKTDYICLNQPEALRLANMEAVEKHFREIHKDTIIKPVESQRVDGVAARSLRCPELARLARTVHEDQRRFPLQIATILSQQFAGHGLQFFKVNKAVTHVCVARPHFLDLSAAPVSDGVKHIVEYINAHPKCTRRQLVETLAPTPPVAPVPIPVAAEGQTPAAAPAAVEPTAEQTAVISDLHWLIHQGHVIEFANGTLEAAKKPAPKPPKPEPKPQDKAPPAEPAAAPEAGQESPAPAPGVPGGTNETAAVPAEVTTEAPAGSANEPSAPALPADQEMPSEPAASQAVEGAQPSASEPVREAETPTADEAVTREPTSPPSPVESPS